MSEVETIQHDGWCEVVMNRPERKNAITGPLGVGLAEAINAASADEDTRVVLLRGAEGAFCSGLDLKEFNADPAPDWLGDFQQIWRGAHRAIFECTTPIVGALERYAINGGAALGLACDLLVAGDESYLQVGEVQIGMAAPYNLAWLNLRHDESTISQVAMIGDKLFGPDLVRLGIAYQSVPDADVVATACGLAERLAGFPGGGLARIKLGVRGRVDGSADEWFDRFTGKDVVGGSPKPKRVS